MVSTLGAKGDDEVYIYDSYYVCVNHAIKNQIAALLAISEKEIKLKFMDIQIQSGGYDCGLFAIANAAVLVLGYEPGKFFFDQSAMRTHLKSCFESGSISLFPVKKTRRAKGRVKSEDSIEIFCDCRMPQLPGVDMISVLLVMNGFTLICVFKAMECTKEEWFCRRCQ